jgi:pilus assembly protein CpaC
MIRAIAIALTLALGAFVASNARAEEHDAAGIVAANGTAIKIESGRGVLVRLEHAATSIFVADPDVADVQVKSQSLLYLVAKKAGTTALFAVNAQDKVVLNVPIEVNYNLTRIQEAIHELVPNAAISVSTIENSVVLDGTVYAASEADDILGVVKRFLPDIQVGAARGGTTGDTKMIVNRIKVAAPNQINLRVRVAEVSRDLIKQFGFNWDAAIQKGNMVFGLAGNNATALATNATTGATVATAAGGVFQTRSLSTDLKTTVNSLFGQAAVGNVDLSSVIDALDNNGLATILAEPNLTAVSGEPASFLVGGEFPIPTAATSTLGIQTVEVSWKKFGVSLNFVATIASGNRINLHVAPEVSQVSNTFAVNIGGIQLPSITTSRAETTVELASGQSIAIAGLLQNDVTETLKNFPFLGDVPILGQLFRSDQFRRQETELVIIVTPYIVRPIAAANKLALPTDGYVAPSDGDMLSTGAEYKAQTLNKSSAPVTRSGSGLIGPVGFDLD